MARGEGTRSEGTVARGGELLTSQGSLPSRRHSPGADPSLLLSPLVRTKYVHSMDNTPTAILDFGSLLDTFTRQRMTLINTGLCFAGAINLPGSLPHAGIANPSGLAQICTCKETGRCRRQPLPRQRPRRRSQPGCLQLQTARCHTRNHRDGIVHRLTLRLGVIGTAYHPSAQDAPWDLASATARWGLLASEGNHHPSHVSATP